MRRASTEAVAEQAHGTKRRRQTTGCLSLSLAASLTALAMLVPAVYGAPPPGWLNEVRLGLLAHDVHFAGGVEHGADLNAELLFRSPVTLDPADPELVKWLLQPRPAIGVEANTDHDTSQIYVGAVWTAPLPWTPHLVAGNTRPAFFNLGLGGAANNGRRHSLQSDRKSLGVHALYHVSGEMGIPVNAYYDLSAFFDHSSNAGSSRYNESLNDAGMRLGCRF